MRELFSDRRHAFFAHAAPVSLGPLPADELADELTERFAAEGGRDPGEALGPLLDAAAGHPQRAMLLAHHLFERLDPGTAAGLEDWLTAEALARREAAGEVQVLWESCTNLERRALKAIADRRVTLTGGDAAARFALPKSGSTSMAVERLAGEGHLTADETTRSGWRVVDPFLGSWRRDDG